MLAQIGGDMFSLIITYVFFIVVAILYQKIIFMQMVVKLEQETIELEGMAAKSKGFVLKMLSKGSNPKLKENVSNFLEFFAIGPVDADPAGVIKKIDHIVRNSDQRFNYFVNQVASGFSDVKKRDVKNALEGAMQVYQYAKVVRHFLELIKKYKMLQLAMMIQMQMPLIKRVAGAAVNATQAFIDGQPIGDGVGPLIASHLMKGNVDVYKEDEFAVVETNLAGRKVFVSKAEGPGASTGYPGKFLIKFFKKHNISKIVTVDAALKLEGEKTGSVAEGVGVAMGGTGVDRYEIEEVAVKYDMPLDAVAVKMSDEDALSPMPNEVLKSVPQAIEAVKKALMRADKNDRILIMGVGNTCGIGNDVNSVAKAEEKIVAHNKKMEEEKKKKQKKFLKIGS